MHCTVGTLHNYALVAFSVSSEYVVFPLFCSIYEVFDPFDLKKHMSPVCFCRVGQARSPLCNMPESRHKDCEPGEAQRVGTNEGMCPAFSGFQIESEVVKVSLHSLFFFSLFVFSNTCK